MKEIKIEAIKKIIKTLVVFLFVTLTLSNAKADSTQSLAGLAEVLEHCGYDMVRSAYYEEEYVGPTVIKDTGEVVYGPGMQKNSCDSLRSGSDLSGYQAQKVLFAQGDRREVLSTAKNVAALTKDSVGVIKCVHEGESYIRGSGSLVHLDDVNFEVIVTSAHVFIDPGSGTRFDNCSITLNKKVKSKNGTFVIVEDVIAIPSDNRLIGDPNHVAQDVALVRIDDKASVRKLQKYGTMPFGFIEESELERYYRAGAKIELIAYSYEHKDITVARSGCMIFQRKEGDLNYGIKGVYNHSCDHTPGGSGGILVASLDGQSIILGINYGKQRDRVVYPNNIEKYPGGVPTNLPFDMKHYVGGAVNFDSDTLRKFYDELKVQGLRQSL